MKKKGTLTLKEVTRLGGLARAKKLNPERRAEIARFGGQVSARNRKLRKNDKKPKTK